MSVNKVILVGRVGSEVEVRQTGGGVAVCNFSLATTESYKDRSGEWQESTEWHNCTAWRGQAEYTGRNISKGDMVYIEGKIKTRKYDTKEGETRYATEIHVDQIQRLVKAGAPKQAPADDKGHEFIDDVNKTFGVDGDNVPF